MNAIEQIVMNLGDPSQAVAHKAWYSLWKMVNVMPGADPEQRSEVADMIAAELKATKSGGKDRDGNEKPPVPKYPTGIRNELLRLIAYVAGVKQVPVIAECMKHLDTREAARCALDWNASKEATQALITALENEVGPHFRVGVVNSLARRDWQSVMVPLQKATRDEQKRVRIAAVEALSNFPDASNEAFIVEMTKDECKRCQKRAHAARVALAYTLVKAGQKPVAKSIFQKIGSSDAPEAQKKAAKLGIKQLG